MDKKIGVLLVNLGSPISPEPKDVYRYLIEFLMDARVIDFPWWKRLLLVRGVIVPKRYRQSAELYKKIWTDEGAPLIVHTQKVCDQLKAILGDSYEIVMAMRYQKPSIREGLHLLKKSKVSEIIILPLFPQYASATTGSIHQRVMNEIETWEAIPKLRFINSFADDPNFIQALAERGRDFNFADYDHILFSFHGLPESQIKKTSPDHFCLTQGCCEALSACNQFCYKAQCHRTSKALSEALSLQPNQYSVCFQSRLGSDPWIKPYTTDILKECAGRGQKRLLVFSPSFVADCLETISEISHEYAEEFRQMGGEVLDLVEGLNSHPLWIKALQNLIQKNS